MISKSQKIVQCSVFLYLYTYIVHGFKHISESIIFIDSASNRCCDDCLCKPFVRVFNVLQKVYASLYHRCIAHALFKMLITNTFNDMEMQAEHKKMH